VRVFLVKWRHFVCLPMIVILPVSLLAQDTTAAILRSNGIGVQVNRNPAPASSALFSGDEIETQKILPHGSMPVDRRQSSIPKLWCSSKSTNWSSNTAACR
jgi:hypothetical protein